MACSTRDLDKRIRAIAKAKAGTCIFWTEHARLRMRQRHITMPMALDVLKSGVIYDEPEPDIKTGHIKCKLERFVAGRQLALVVALHEEGADICIVVTAIAHEEMAMYHFTDGGLRNVWIENGYTIQETPYGKAVCIEDPEGLAKAVCSALIRKKSKLTGAEFRYIRQAMLLSQASLGRYLGRSDQAVALWEKTSKVPKYADTLLRVLYARHADGDERIKNIVHALNEQERMVDIILKETKKGWTYCERPADNDRRALAAA